MVGTVRAEDVVVLLLALVMVAILVGLYLLPSIVAATRRVPHAGPVVVVNVFLGWTLIGWVVALALALRDLPRPRESTTFVRVNRRRRRARRAPRGTARAPLH